MLGDREAIELMRKRSTEGLSCQQCSGTDGEQSHGDS